MTVTVFTNPNNPQCEATEQELSKLGVRYVAVDLTQNPSTFEQIKDAGFKQIGRHLTEFLMERTSPRPHPPAGAKHRGVGAATAVKHPDSRKARIPNGNNPEESNPPRQNPQQNPTAIVRNRSKSATQSKAASRNIARPAA